MFLRRKRERERKENNESESYRSGKNGNNREKNAHSIFELRVIQREVCDMCIMCSIVDKHTHRWTWKTIRKHTPIQHWNAYEIQYWVVGRCFFLFRSHIIYLFGSFASMSFEWCFCCDIFFFFDYLDKMKCVRKRSKNNRRLL